MTFALQVSEDGGESWEDAGTYFEGYTGGDPGDLWTEYEFAQTISGPVNQTIRGSFDDLPTVITRTAEPGGEASIISLEYRVVEKAVKFGNREYTVQMQDGNYTVADNAPFVPVGPSGDGDNAHTNQLKTTSLTVEKVWVDDSDNLYGSRPHDGNPSCRLVGYLPHPAEHEWHGMDACADPQRRKCRPPGPHRDALWHKRRLDGRGHHR